MKTKILFATFFVVGLLSSCTKVNDVAETKPENKTILSPEESRALLYSSTSKISYDQAEAFAIEAMQMLDRNNVATRTARTLGTIKPVIGETEIKTRSGESMKITDTTMYIFNFADDHGYALISTNCLTQNIIAIVENGSLNSVSNVCNGEMPQLYYAILAHESEKQFMLKNLDSLTNSAYTKLDKLNLDSEPSSRTIITDVVHNNEYGAGSITITDNGYRKTYLPWTIHQKNYFVKSVWGIQGDFTKNCPKASCGHKCSVGSHTPAIAQLAY